MYTNEEINVLSAVTEINHNMDDLIEAVNNLNIMSMKIVAEKDPENVTNEMILALARNGVDVRDLNDYFNDVLPECLEIVDKKTIHEPQMIKVKVKKKTDKTGKASDRNQDETLQLHAEDVQPIPRNAKSVMGAVPPAGRRYTDNVVHDDKKRGVIFAKCNKSPEIENRVVDELIQAANDRDIMIRAFIVNEKDGVDKLKAWMESETIDYIIMNNLEEYSQYQLTQFYFLDEAFRCGIKVLLKDNDFNPVFPF